MFEAIGIFAVWLVGLGLAFVGPILASTRIAKTGDGLSDLAFGVMWSKIMTAVYVLATVAYLAVT
jgi:ABC-type Mn2+/Zn2+ transport system permease subunit